MLMNEEVALPHFVWPQSNPLPSHQDMFHSKPLHFQQPRNLLHKMHRINLGSPSVSQNFPQKHCLGTP